MKKQGPFLHELLFILNMDDSGALGITGAHTKTLTRILDDDGSELSAQMGAATGLDTANADELAAAIGPLNSALVAQVADLTRQVNESSATAQELQQRYNDVSARAVDLDRELMHVTQERDSALLREQALTSAAEAAEQSRQALTETLTQRGLEMNALQEQVKALQSQLTAALGGAG